MSLVAIKMFYIERIVRALNTETGNIKYVSFNDLEKGDLSVEGVIRHPLFDDVSTFAMPCLSNFVCRVRRFGHVGSLVWYDGLMYDVGDSVILNGVTFAGKVVRIDCADKVTGITSTLSISNNILKHTVKGDVVSQSMDLETFCRVAFVS